MVNLFTLSSQENRFLTPCCVLQDSKIHLLEQVQYYTTLIPKTVSKKTRNISSQQCIPHRIILSNRNATRRNVEVLNGHQEMGWVQIAKIVRGPGAPSLKMTIFQTEWRILQSRGAKHYNRCEHARSREEIRNIIKNSCDELINYAVRIVARM